MKLVNKQTIMKTFIKPNKFKGGKSGVYYTIDGRLMKDGKDVYIAIPSNGNIEKAVTKELCLLHNMKEQFICKSMYNILLEACVGWFWSHDFILNREYFSDKYWLKGLKPNYGFLVTEEIY